MQAVCHGVMNISQVIANIMCETFTSRVNMGNRFRGPAVPLLVHDGSDACFWSISMLLMLSRQGL